MIAKSKHNLLDQYLIQLAVVKRINQYFYLYLMVGRKLIITLAYPSPMFIPKNNLSFFFFFDKILIVLR